MTNRCPCGARCQAKYLQCCECRRLDRHITREATVSEALTPEQIKKNVAKLHSEFEGYRVEKINGNGEYALEISKLIDEKKKLFKHQLMPFDTEQEAEKFARKQILEARGGKRFQIGNKSGRVPYDEEDDA